MMRDGGGTPFTESDMAELQRRRKSDALTTWMLAIGLSVYVIFGLSHDWKSSLIAWICGGGLLSTYLSWRKLRG